MLKAMYKTYNKNLNTIFANYVKINTSDIRLIPLDHVTYLPLVGFDNIIINYVPQSIILN